MPEGLAGDGVRQQPEGASDAEEVHQLRDTEKGHCALHEARGFLLQLRCWAG